MSFVLCLGYSTGVILYDVVQPIASLEDFARSPYQTANLGLSHVSCRMPLS